MAAFSDLKAQFDTADTAILAASVDDEDQARAVQAELAFPIAYGVTRAQAARIGAWWEDRRSIIQPAEFLLGNDGKVVSATYSTGPIGRLMPEDALKLINFLQSAR